MLRVLVCGAFVVAAAGGCSRGDQRPPVVLPMSELTGVRLGMSASDLRQHRPAAKEAPYLGLNDSIAGFEIQFKLSGAVLEVPAPGDSRLVQVVAIRAFTDTGSANAELARLVKSLGTPLACSRLQAIPVTTVFVRQWDSEEYVVRYWAPTETELVSGIPRYPPRVSITWRSQGQGNSESSTVPCPPLNPT